MADPDDQLTTTIATVVLVPGAGKLGPLDYRIPATLHGIEAGTRVLVPLGSRRCMGVVVEIGVRGAYNSKLRDVIDRLDSTPVLRPPLMRLVAWMAQYYLAPLSDALETALPGALRIETEKTVHFAAPAAENARLTDIDREVLDHIQRHDPIGLPTLVRDHGDEAEAAVRRLRRRKLVETRERFVRETAPTRHEISYEAVAPDDANNLTRRPALRALHEYMMQHPSGRVTVRELRGSFTNAAAKVRQLRDLGLLRRHQREVYRDVALAPSPVDHKVELNRDQESAVDHIVADMHLGFSPTLLLGVTGSGKTEVYLRVIAAALATKRTALILVPEISLTHLLVGRVRARFDDQIAVLHSALGVGERWDEWRRLARGEARIAIGARSAVFAPLPDLGVIIVDEEHDSAYKQSDGVRYHARDLAVMRAKLEQCSLVLGSATASIESIHNARTERYRLAVLPERVEKRPMPEVELIDLRGTTLDTPISPPLAAAIEANLTAGNQTLLFLNRRGFANALQCNACGEAVACPNCSISLTWHQRSAALRCHYCDHTVRRPETCPECGEAALATWGWGTERLEVLLRQNFPGARVARMDRDTTRRKGSLAQLLGKWNANKLDLLIGTQMVTKGHDVAGVTLVGVIMADLTLNLPDFRSAERGFQQLAQVAGRAGRGNRPGRVMIQTLQPDHYVLAAVAAHDFRGFADREVGQREELGYPPFGRLALVRCEGEDPTRAEHAARTCAESMRASAPPGVAILGPAPAPLARLRGRYRWQILLRGANGRSLRSTAAKGRDATRMLRDIRVTVDVDPQSLL